MVDERPTRPKRDMDDRLVIPLDPETAIKGLLAVDPDSEPVEDDAARAHDQE